ncbi:hypothetical protein FCR2A7T_21780 [Flavobacterium cauense R2A-7]|nr:hypothetical protein FCR2A7T_21780 [Flavobacterium cauense R2A-7]
MAWVKKVSKLVCWLGYRLLSMEFSVLGITSDFRTCYSYKQ